MQAEAVAIAGSLLALSGVLFALSGRAAVPFVRDGKLTQLMWGMGLGFGALATTLEFLAYVGIVTTLLLQAYVFLSAAIVGTQSLGSIGYFRLGIWARLYQGYIGLTALLVAGFSFTTPLPASMVQVGIIAGNPPVLLLVLSSLVTVPATIVLLTAAVQSLRRSFRWRGFMIVAGTSVLGAGGVFYIASFPVMLYYAEFIGIVLLFLGLVDLSRWSSPASAAAARSHQCPA